MKKSAVVLAVALLVAVLGTSTADAQSQPSAKVTAKTANLTLLPETTGTGGWQTVLSNTIKTANQKDLFINASFEVGLFTQTLVSSKNMTKDTSTADANVQVQVLLDGQPVQPGDKRAGVVYGRRTQTLSATLEGAIAGCLSIVTNLDGSQSIVLDPTCVLPETIELILDSMDAASFNFVAVDVPQGVHTITVQARIDTTGSADTGSFKAMGTVGKGSMTVESVRLIKDPNVILSVD
ncbi:MAG: hypothetical protein DMD89_17290 [Candidatus Rokuibacteriota bacterium]|nr:MAG: hypothetical protein DMD89_17290 [Candidatus Rokubacteria bacterium]